ncbi:tetratricopeptide repeat protein, partial [Sneathiella sp.]|uniref:SPOR domain-containing protein n=1 Tax=Sneathiella sp. TaxID=1964365 RepID=UPI002606CDF0
MRVAARAWQKNDSTTALGIYATAAKQRPTDPAPYLKISEILRKTGRPQEAITVYQRVLAFDATNLAAHHGIGFSHLQMEKPYLASQSFTNALQIDDNDSKSLGGLAVALDKAGDHEKAQSYYQRAVKADPNNLNHKSNLALSLALSGKTEQAIAILKVVTETPGATAQHRQTLALAYGLAGKSGEALKYSRMDLSEEDARNNALYFEALNSDTDEQVASLDDQIKKMKASHDTVVAEERAKDTMPRLPENPDILVSRLDEERLSTNATTAKKSAPSQTEPKSLVPASNAPMMMAKSEAPASKAAPVKDVAPVVVAKKATPKPEEKPVVLAAKEVKAPAEKPVTTAMKKHEPAKEKPVTFVKKEATPVMEKPVTVAKKDMDPKDATSPSEKPVTFVKKESKPVEKPVTMAKAESPAPAREWTLDQKAAPVLSKKSEPVVANLPADTAPAVKKVNLVPGNMPINGEVSAYKPDGGSYFLQIGSYKEKTDAEKGWKIVQTQNVDLLGGVDPVIQEIDLGEDKGGLFYRLKIGGFSDKVRTMQLCGSLRDREFDCFMPVAPKSKTPVKKDSTPSLAPNQRMVDGGNTGKPTAPTDQPLTADFGEGFNGAL